MTTTPSKSATPRSPVAKSTPSKAVRQPATKAASAKALVATKAKSKPSVSAPVKAQAAVAEVKPKKIKVVRDSFTFPKADYEQLAQLKSRALALGISIKKSELLRCGLALLVAADDTRFKTSLNALPKVKAGRPGQ